MTYDIKISVDGNIIEFLRALFAGRDRVNEGDKNLLDLSIEAGLVKQVSRPNSLLPDPYELTFLGKSVIWEQPVVAHNQGIKGLRITKIE
jgi:hypothetical protein